MKIGVVGAGNGGLAVAGDLAIRGCQVRIYDSKPALVADVRRRGGIELQGAVTGFGSVTAVDQLSELVAEVDAVLAVVPAFAHREVAQQLAPFLASGQWLIAVPGATGGALEIRSTLVESGCHGVRVAETQTLPYAARAVGPATVRIGGIKARVLLAALPSRETGQLLTLLQPWIPSLQGAPSALHTSLENMNAVIHPAGLLMNVGRVEGAAPYDFYAGITPSVARIVQQVDQERCEVASALGVKATSLAQWFRDTYGASGVNVETALEELAASVYSGIRAPSSTQTRYLSEDVPYGLVPLAALGQVAGIRTPVMDALTVLAMGVTGEQFDVTGRTLERLGLKGVDRTRIRAVLSGSL